jgi:nucleoside-diphosphate-sugar epimerase
MLRVPIVSGGAGFIGSNLVRRLANLDEVERVYCVDLPNSYRFEELSKLKKVEILPIDLTDPASSNLLPTNVTSVFALAAMNGTPRFYTNPYTVLANSTLPTLSIIKKYSKIAPITYTSSSEVYATTIQDFPNAKIVPTSENIRASIGDIHNPRWSYATAKLLGEVAINSACVEFGTKASIIRYHNIYGPNMGLGHFIPDFIHRANKNEFIIQGGNSTRSFLHISDAIDGTILAMKASSLEAPIYHLGSSHEISIEKAAKLILKLMGIHGMEIQSISEPVGSVKRRCPNISKARTDLGWEPKIELEEGISHYLLNNIEKP